MDLIEVRWQTFLHILLHRLPLFLRNLIFSLAVFHVHFADLRRLWLLLCILAAINEKTLEACRVHNRRLLLSSLLLLLSVGILCIAESVSHFSAHREQLRVLSVRFSSRSVHRVRLLTTPHEIDTAQGH